MILWQFLKMEGVLLSVISKLVYGLSYVDIQDNFILCKWTPSSETYFAVELHPEPPKTSSGWVSFFLCFGVFALRLLICLLKTDWRMTHVTIRHISTAHWLCSVHHYAHKSAFLVLIRGFRTAPRTLIVLLSMTVDSSWGKFLLMPQIWFMSRLHKSIWHLNQSLVYHTLLIVWFSFRQTV